MFISPIKVIESGWITGVKEEMVQPNGIDFTLDKLYQTVKDRDWFALGHEFKQHREWEPVEPFEFEARGFGGDCYTAQAFSLKASTSYDFQSDLKVNIPRDIVAYLIVRSTLNRNQMFITSGLYDSGFIGNIGGQLHNRGNHAVLEKGVRIGQIVFADAQSISAYNGSYQNLTSHWADENQESKNL